MSKKQTATSGMEWNTMLGLTQRLKQDKMHCDYLLITVGCYFGLRIGDLLFLRWRDLLNQGELIIMEQKTKKSRKITINPKVIDAINFCSNELKSKETFAETGYLFANRWGGAITISYVNKRLKVIFKKYNVNVKNASSHTL